jgi:hypothetical protein
MARCKEIDGFFWDEPHYAYSEENTLPTDLSPHYVCGCEVCRRLFLRKYGYDMHEKENHDIHEFKEQNLIGFLQDLCRTVKNTEASKKNTICIMPSFAATGISTWDHVCFAEMDTLATDPYWILYGKDLKWVKKEAEKLVGTAREHRKAAQLWVLAFLIPENREHEIEEAVEILAASGADSIFAWLFKGGLQTVIRSSNPRLVWQTVGSAFTRIRDRSGEAAR